MAKRLMQLISGSEMEALACKGSALFQQFMFREEDGKLVDIYEVDGFFYVECYIDGHKMFKPLEEEVNSE